MNELMVNAHASEYGVPCRWQASDSHVENVIRSESGVLELIERPVFGVNELMVKDHSSGYGVPCS